MKHSRKHTSRQPPATAAQAAVGPPLPSHLNVDMDVLQAKLRDAMTTPGLQVAFDPDEAAYLGAFVEDALSESDALQSSDDLINARP